MSGCFTIRFKTKSEEEYFVVIFVIPTDEDQTEIGTREYTFDYLNNKFVFVLFFVLLPEYKTILIPEKYPLSDWLKDTPKHMIVGSECIPKQNDVFRLLKYIQEFLQLKSKLH